MNAYEPTSLQTAVNSAMAEQNLRKRFGLRLGHRERTDRLDRHDGPTTMVMVNSLSAI
jgi:hypothetical protein